MEGQKVFIGRKWVEPKKRARGFERDFCPPSVEGYSKSLHEKVLAY